MQDLYNNIAVGLFITAFVLFITRAILCFKRDGLKGGFTAKGYWGLWVIGLVFLILGFGAHNVANQYKVTDPNDPLAQILSRSVPVDVPASPSTTTASSQQ